MQNCLVSIAYSIGFLRKNDLGKLLGAFFNRIKFVGWDLTLYAHFIKHFSPCHHVESDWTENACKFT